MSPGSRLSQRSDNLVRGLALHGDFVYSVTHANAPHYGVVRARIDTADWKRAETVVPEAVDSVDRIDQSRDYLVVTYWDRIGARG